MTSAGLFAISLLLLPNTRSDNLLLLKLHSDGHDSRDSGLNETGQDYSLLWDHYFHHKASNTTPFWSPSPDELQAFENKNLPKYLEPGKQESLPNEKEDTENCNDLPPDIKKNKRMKRNLAKRRLKGKKAEKISWGFWVKRSTSKKEQGANNFCCRRGARKGNLVKKWQICVEAPESLNMLNSMLKELL